MTKGGSYTAYCVQHNTQITAETYTGIHTYIVERAEIYINTDWHESNLGVFSPHKCICKRDLLYTAKVWLTSTVFSCRYFSVKTVRM